MTGFGINVLGFGSGGGGPVTLENEGTINGQENREVVTASDFIGDSGTLIIPTDFWVWSNSTSTAALIVDVAGATIENNGKIIGKGNYGGNNASGAPAISITATGVTIINSSGSYIAGGGGSGGRGNTTPSGGGSGAGFSALLNAEGADGFLGATGGGSGGGGGGYHGTDDSTSGMGGRILPGTGGAGGLGNGGGRGGAGGSAGAAGAGGGSLAGGGGGGWGANGGNGGYSGAGAGGAGGKAIEDNGNTYTLSNSGTIYGATT
tara:strand:+ start:119 stop:907 length:789 start_codon:yes stop_codon:yes gene_type:complete